MPGTECDPPREASKTGCPAVSRAARLDTATGYLAAALAMDQGMSYPPSFADSLGRMRLALQRLMEMPPGQGGPLTVLIEDEDGMTGITPAMVMAELLGWRDGRWHGGPDDIWPLWERIEAARQSMQDQLAGGP